MPEPNTVENENEPTLEQFNEPTAPAEKEPEAQPAAEPAKANEPAPAAEPKAGQEAQPATQQQPQPQQQVEDAYAKVLEGVQVPNGVEVDDELLAGVKAIAKEYNIPAEAVKKLMQMDMNNTYAEALVEDKLIASAQQRWQAENQAKYGDNLKNVETNCSRVLAELDKDGKFKELLATAGVSKHPATLGFLKSIGELYLEKPSVNPNATVSTDEEVELEDFN